MIETYGAGRPRGRPRPIDIRLQKRNSSRELKADKDNIATFVEVIRRRSLAAAARHLGVPKSTVSRRLARLEEQLDTKLVHRDARRVTATSEGSRFYESVVDAVDVLNTAVATIELNTTEPRGTIRVTAPGDLGRLLLIPHFVAFLERYPDISLDLVFTNRFVDLVQEGVDLALRAGRVTEPNLIARNLFPSDFRLAAHPGADIECTDIAELERYPFVLYRGRGRTQVFRLERGSDEQRESVELTVHGRVNVDDYGAMAELVAAGQGIGLMPEIHIAEGKRTGRLVPLFPEWSLPAPPVHLVYPTRQLPERVRLLIDYLSHAFAGV
ncbi:MAG: LysR family transcriptional regulator [Myxococcales bacterium]|nr:LysR family transcriptional regulator [Myxococcales bacterium]